MKINPRSLMASSINSSNHGFNATPMALLPPIPLYRRILRTHRKHLPKQMRLLGDEYVKKEFRSHKNIENPIHIIGFLKEWQMYAQKLEGNEWIGERMDPAKIEKMSGMF
ncbi:Succinate dehydrogenase assembly factor 3, mitochondrial [Erysiphe necator]|uniref:Succinate dehydrogenase assembly factor 3 n=1 Tax=Uncinula necator TaxID=52586 RepID=A0A0B1P0S8_UNCNE|nr:Succinate dehydrogenase assembly factor 3, mitochondrial [Erysiphe necator]KHJ30885.1 putative acn9 family domain containing protein [Erysiphe necator]